MVFTVTILGAGDRGFIYAKLLQAMPDKFKLVAVVDPIDERRARIQSLVTQPLQQFKTDTEFFGAPKCSDLLVISTQDARHFNDAVRGMRLGYDLLLEKPVVTKLADLEVLERTYQETNRRVVVCHVLRYTQLYQKVHELITSGILGDIRHVQASEGVGPFHFAHSYVRGHWADAEKTSPILISKSSHDFDLITWFISTPCRRVSSFGSLNYFTDKHRPLGAPKLCTDFCPHRSTCEFDVFRYLSSQTHRLKAISDRLEFDQRSFSDWVGQTPWARCVFSCENSALENQVVNMEFENGITATFTLSAFKTGRNLEIQGTKAILRAGADLKKETGVDIMITGLGETRSFNLDHTTDHHLGGDAGLIGSLYQELTGPRSNMHSGLDKAIVGHRIAFKAEEARVTKSVVTL